MVVRRYSEKDEAFLRRVIFPEEDRRLFTTAPWSGGFRWFKSSNVTPIEHYQRVNIQAATTKRAASYASPLPAF
jgi:hypothetical protein